jgi:hypothetical protein
LMSITKFCRWNSLPFLNAILAHFSSPDSIRISSLKVLTVCICFRSSSQLPIMNHYYWQHLKPCTTEHQELKCGWKCHTGKTEL